MTSIAVTASICASASEAALLVASFMSNSLDLGVTHRCAKHARTMAIDFVLGTPRDEYSPLIESPLGEYRPSQSRTAIRRQFGSRAAGLCTGEGVFWSGLELLQFARALQTVELRWNCSGFCHRIGAK